MAASSTTSVNAVSSDKFPKHPKGVLRNEKTPVNERVNAAVAYLQELLELPSCILLRAGKNKELYKCRCMHNHFEQQRQDGNNDNNENDTVMLLFQRVANAMVSFHCRSRDERMQDLVNIKKESDNIDENTISNSSRRRVFSKEPLIIFVLPERQSPNPQEQEEDHMVLKNSTPKMICQSTLMNILGIGCRSWNTVRLAATKNTIPAHGLKEKQSNHRIAGPTSQSLTQFFQGLRDCAEPRAIRVATTAAVNATTTTTTTTTGSVIVHDDNTRQPQLPPSPNQPRDEYEIYEILPNTWSQRGLHGKWLNGIGYSIVTDAKGNSIISEKVAGTCTIKSLPFVTFRAFWHRHFPKLVLVNRFTKTSPLPPTCHADGNQHHSNNNNNSYNNSNTAVVTTTTNVTTAPSQGGESSPHAVMVHPHYVAVAQWLKEKLPFLDHTHVERYVSKFVENGMDSLEYLEEDLDSNDLESIAMKKGHAKRLTRILKEENHPGFAYFMY